MRKIIMMVVAAVTIMVGGVVGTQQASAYDLPPDANGRKFWSPSVCVEPGAGIPDAIASQTSYRLAYIAQLWNERTTILALDYSTDCAADGYPPSRRMVIGTYSNATDGHCLHLVNQETSLVNGMRRYTNGPGSYINTAGACTDSQIRRDKMVSEAIGGLLGLATLNSTGYNSRVMNNTAYSWANATLPDQNSGNTLSAIYAYTYCQPFGTAC